MRDKNQSTQTMHNNNVPCPIGSGNIFPMRWGGQGNSCVIVWGGHEKKLCYLPCNGTDTKISCGIQPADGKIRDILSLSAQQLNFPGYPNL